MCVSASVCVHRCEGARVRCVQGGSPDGEKGKGRRRELRPAVSQDTIHVLRGGGKGQTLLKPGLASGPQSRDTILSHMAAVRSPGAVSPIPLPAT